MLARARAATQPWSLPVVSRLLTFRQYTTPTRSHPTGRDPSEGDLAHLEMLRMVLRSHTWLEPHPLSPAVTGTITGGVEGQASYPQKIVRTDQWSARGRCSGRP